MERRKKFIVDDNEFIFDGTAVAILKNNQSSSKQELKYKKINSQRSDNLKTLCLVVNNDCNLCCEYCFANKGHYDRPNEKMSFEIAKNSIDMLIRTVISNHQDKITISFFGGEPLLNFSLIRKCVEYIEKFKNIKSSYMITTNGTLMTREIVKFLEYYKFDIMISIDGNKKVHDVYRKYYSGKGSYDCVVRGINLFANKEVLNTRITIGNHNPDINQYIDSILNLGVKRVTFAVDYNISTSSFEVFIESIQKLMNRYFDDIMIGKYYDITNFSSIIVAIALNQRKLAFCNAGISYLTVSAEGILYRCPRFIGNKKYSIATVSDVEKLEEMGQLFKESLKSTPGERNDECNKCVYTYICGGMCYHHAVMAGKDEFQNVPRECYQRRVIFDGIIQMICKLPIEKRRELLLFYTNLWNTVKGE